jgi:cob(I)alamin adenosyltransferase
MTVAALFAVGKGGEGKVAPIADERITELENEIDAMQATIPAITKFTIPGGDERISMCHVCRTICRRAERMALVVSQQHNLSDDVLAYLNRLSDYLYLLGRTVTMITHTEEILWIP